MWIAFGAMSSGWCPYSESNAAFNPHSYRIYSMAFIWYYFSVHKHRTKNHWCKKARSLHIIKFIWKKKPTHTMCMNVHQLWNIFLYGEKSTKKKKINNKIYDQNSKPYALLRPKTQSPIAIDIHRTTIIVSAKANTHSQMIRNNFEVSELIQLD